MKSEELRIKNYPHPTPDKWNSRGDALRRPMQCDALRRPLQCDALRRPLQCDALPFVGVILWGYPL